MSSLLQPFPVFKSGAVLKHSDLNAIVTYLESQIQASRRYLDGLGILEGLEVSCTTAAGATTLDITPGVAVLPDGQLVELTTPRSFKFTRPVNPDSKEGQALGVCFGDDVVELTNDVAGVHTPLRADETRCVLVYAKKEENVSTEASSSCVRQSDLNEYRTPELRFFLGARRPHVFEQPRMCFSSPCLPLLQEDELTGRSFPEILYKTLPKTAKEILSAYEQMKACFPDIFCEGDFEGLTVLTNRLGKKPEHVFYAYDYLKTLIAAYREFTQLPYLSGLYSRAEQDKCPEILSLGQCGKHCGCRQYWQPARARADERTEAVFYARRMVLLAEFDPGLIEQTPVRLTPSSSDRFPLSRRAIPFYANPKTLSPWWNFSLHNQNLEETIPHYGLDFCRGHLCYTEASDFIRVEGHVGMPLNAALINIERCRKNLNLPFSVIALEMNQDDTEVSPLWQPHFDDLERLFQIQFGYFLAALDVFHNINPQAEKSQILWLLGIAEETPCYKDFDYEHFIVSVQELIDSITYFSSRELAADNTFTNVFDGLKVIWRSRQARLRQLFVHRFLQCQNGFEPMCGVPRGGTLAILYKREQQNEIGQQAASKPKSEQKDTAEIAPEMPRLKGIVVGDLAIPCCDIDLTRTPVAVFSVSIRPKTYRADGPNDPSEGIEMEEYFYVLGMNVMLRSLALHYDTIEWLIEIKGEDGVFQKDTSWGAKGCNSLFQFFKWEGNRYNFKQITFRATQTARKDDKMDVYTEEFKVWVPDQQPVRIPVAESEIKERRAKTAKTDAAREKTPDLS